jgi:hypothetical protein
MHGIGLDQDVRRWFDVRVPRPKVARDRIARALNQARQRTITVCP